MNKTHFRVIVALLVVLIVMLGWDIRSGDAKPNGEEDSSQLQEPAPKIEVEPVRYVDTVVDACSICGRDRVSAHGSIILRNTTNHTVQISVRHHPEASESIVQLDPKGVEFIDDILIGTLKLRAVGEGFDEESFCAISANTQHEMWWRITGFEMHGSSAMNMGANMWCQ